MPFLCVPGNMWRSSLVDSMTRQIVRNGTDNCLPRLRPLAAQQQWPV